LFLIGDRKGKTTLHLRVK